MKGLVGLLAPLTKEEEEDLRSDQERDRLFSSG